MKKLVLLLAVVFSVSLFSCGNVEHAAEAVDSAATEAVEAVDSTAAAAADTVKAAADTAAAKVEAAVDSVKK